MCILGNLPRMANARVNTLGNPWLEFDAARNIVGMKMAWFTGVPAGEFFRDVQRAGIRQLPANLQPAHESGQFFLTLDLANKLKLPVLRELEVQIRERLPEALLKDPHADWNQWPSGFKFAPGDEL